MRQFFQKPFRWAVTYTVILLAAVVYILLDTFVIPRTGVALGSVPSAAAETVVSDTPEASDQTTVSDDADAESAGSYPVVTDTSYEDENIKISIETTYEYDTAVYIADIEVSDASYLKTAFAQGTFGRNIKETTSAMAESNDAIFAVNGDYYGFRNNGYVLRNGTLYRDSGGGREDLVIDSAGNFSIIEENDTSAQALADAGAWQVFSFGPALIENGEIAVTENSEVSQAKTSNPRTAIGQVSALHYIVVVSDGRTDESAGLSLLELAQVFQSRGCTVAYNLDGGGSSTMWFNGRVINNPTDGRNAGERSVSDIVYFGD